MTDTDRLPATLAFDLIYCLVLEDTREAHERRDELEEQLGRMVGTSGGKPDRATWGLLPHQQRAMRAARDAGGSAANAARARRVAGRR